MYDLLDYLRGDGTPVGITHAPGGDGIYQCELDGNRWFQKKGSFGNLAQFEELMFDDNFIYRGLDTSPASGVPYTLRDDPNVRGSKWAPRRMAIGDVYERNPHVYDVNRATGALTHKGQQRSWLKLVRHHDTWHVAHDVLELWWLTGSPNDAVPEEAYFFARNLGLVGFDHRDLHAWVNHVWPAKPPAPNVPVLQRETVTFDKASGTPTPTPPPAGDQRRLRSDIYANVRHQPTTASTTLRQLSPGTIVTIKVTVNGRDNDGYKWHELSDGGFVREDLFEGYTAPAVDVTEPVAKYRSPLRASYSITGRHNQEGHNGYDLAVAKGSNVYARGSGRVAFTIHCARCTDDKPNGLSQTPPIPLGSSAIKNDVLWGWGYGNAAVVVYDYAELPDTARRAMDALPGAPKFAYGIFAHLSEMKVAKGDCVGVNTVVGKSGNTGNSSGNHLHLEVRVSTRGDEASLMSRTQLDPALIFAL